MTGSQRPRNHEIKVLSEAAISWLKHTLCVEAVIEDDPLAPVLKNVGIARELLVRAGRAPVGDHGVPGAAGPALQVLRDRHPGLFPPLPLCLVLGIVEQVISSLVLQNARLVEPALLPGGAIFRAQAGRINNPVAQVPAAAEPDDRGPLFQSRTGVSMIGAELISALRNQLARRKEAVLPQNPIHRHVVFQGRGRRVAPQDASFLAYKECIQREPCQAPGNSPSRDRDIAKLLLHYVAGVHDLDVARPSAVSRHQVRIDATPEGGQVQALVALHGLVSPL